MKLHEIYINETIKTFGPRSDWFDESVAIYNAKGLDALFTYVARTLSIPITSVKLDFEADMDEYTTRDEAVEEWLIFLDEFSPSPLNASAAGGDGGGGASAGAGGGASAGATSSSGDSGSADSGAGDSGSDSADSTPSVAPANRGLFVGSMAPKKKKKKKFKFGTGVYEAEKPTEPGKEVAQTTQPKTMKRRAFLKKAGQYASAALNPDVVAQLAQLAPTPEPWPSVSLDPDIVPAVKPQLPRRGFGSNIQQRYSRIYQFADHWGTEGRQEMAMSLKAIAPEFLDAIDEVDWDFLELVKRYPEKITQFWNDLEKVKDELESQNPEGVDNWGQIYDPALHFDPELHFEPHNEVEEEPGKKESLAINSINMKTKEQLLTELNTFKPTKRLIVEQKLGINEYDIISYIIGYDNLKQLFPNAQLSGQEAQKESFEGIRWIKKKLEAWKGGPKSSLGGKHYYLQGPWQDLMLGLNGKIQPDHSNAGSLVSSMLKFAKEVAVGVNTFSQIVELVKDANRDYDTSIQGGATPKTQQKYKYELETKIDELTGTVNKLSGDLDLVISQIEVFIRLFENTIALEKLNKVIKAYNNLDWGRKSIMETQYIMEFFTPHVEGHYTSEDITKFLRINYSQKIVDRWLDLENTLMTVKFQGDTSNQHWNLAQEADLDAFNDMFDASEFEAIDVQWLHGVTYWKTIPTDPMHSTIND